MKTLFFFAATCMLLFSPFFALAQPETENSLLLEQVLEQNVGGSEDQPDLTELAEKFREFLDRPINLNNASADELWECGLFSEILILNLLAHIEKYGKLIAVHELQVVRGFSEELIRQIMPYITTGNDIDDPNAKFFRMVRDGKHQLITRFQIVPEEKKGFRNENGPAAYKGSPWSIYTRYRFSFMKKMSWGFVADKDAGEEFFKGSRKDGFDFYSGHFAIRNTGPFRIIAIGDYQLEYGQGLTLWTGLSGGKSPDPAMIIRNGQGIRPYTSSNEVYFKRGAAVSIGRKKFSLDLFASIRKLDANMSTSSDTSSSSEFFTSIQESGYHRTENEIADRRAITELMYGAHGGYRSRKFRTGFTVVNTSFDHSFKKDVKPYNRFEFKGRQLSNAGADYAWLFRNMNLFGEVSVSENGVVAFVNGIVISVDSRLNVSFLYRNFPVKFQSLYSSAFRESGNNFNEKGFYSGITFRPSRVFSITCNYDRFYFGWLKYRTDSPSGGYEFSTLFSYKPSRKSELYVRYRETSKAINNDASDWIMNYTVPVFQRGIRIHLTSKVSKSFTLRTRVESVVFRKEFRNENGFMIFQDVQFHPMGFPISFNLRYALFDSDSYDSRIYAYENDVLYGYSIPGYYYKGSRFYFNMRYKLRKGIDVWFRYAATFYSNRNVIGSGLDEITGSRKSEIKFQVRFEF